jgi:hypothetical protein
MLTALNVRSFSMALVGFFVSNKSHRQLLSQP